MSEREELCMYFKAMKKVKNMSSYVGKGED